MTATTRDIDRHFTEPADVHAAPVPPEQEWVDTNADELHRLLTGAGTDWLSRQAGPPRDWSPRLYEAYRLLETFPDQQAEWCSTLMNTIDRALEVLADLDSLIPKETDYR